MRGMNVSWRVTHFLGLLLLGASSIRTDALPNAHIRADFQQDYTGPGPLTTWGATAKLEIANTDPSLRKLLADKPIHLTVSITAPDASSVSPIPGPYPVVLLLNGYQTLAESYAVYAKRVASFGYVVVQYDIDGLIHVPGLLPDIHVRIEVGFMPVLLQLLSTKSATPGDVLFGLVDTARVATMGHSRGGKLAALHLAEYSFVQTACLLDPVDGDSSMPESDDNPSALRALAGSGKTAAVIGAGVLGQCAPTDYNYAKFREVLGVGSWTQVIKEAGHTQVVDLSGPAAWVADYLCGAGNITRARAIAISLPTFVAWLEKTFRPQADTAVQLLPFFQWVDRTVHSNEITFFIKADEDLRHPARAGGVDIRMGSASSEQKRISSVAVTGRSSKPRLAAEW